MDNEFYFEESNPRKSKLIFVGIVLVVALLCVGLVVLRDKYTLNVKKDLVYEIGSTIDKDVSLFVNNKVNDENEYQLLLTSVPIEDNVLTKVGDYTFKVKYKNITKKGKIKVVDTVAPMVEVMDLTIGVDEELDINNFITKCEDYSMPCKVEYKNSKDEEKIKSIGEYTFDIVISDLAGNKVTKTVNLEVKKDYNSVKNKESDLKVDHISPTFDDWKGEMVIKYDKGYDPNYIEETDAYAELMEITTADYHKYLDSMYENNLITDSQLIDVYNKYGLIIGYGVWVKLDNGLSFYLQK